jgi:hypothetical protein
MRVGSERRLADARQELAEGRIAGELGPQRERVHEEPDQVLELRTVPVGDRGPHHEVRLVREPREQRLEAREQRHEERRPFAAAELPQTFEELRGQGEAARVPAAAREGRPRMVGGQGEVRRCSGEDPAPMRELELEPLAREPLALPAGEVCVLDRELGERRGLALLEGSVEERELAQQETQRPAVGRDVVERQEEDVLRRREAQEAGAEHGPALEIERPARLFRDEALELLLASLPRRERDLRGVRDRLPRLAVLDREGRAQGLVTPDDLGQRALERARVERTLEPQGQRQVVGGRTRLEPVEEPQPLLREGERQRKPAVPRPRGDRWSGRSGPDEGLDPPGQGSEPRALEERPERKLDREGAADARDEPGGEQRVPAQREEVRFHRDLLATEERRDEPGQDLLAGGARRDEARTALGRPRRRRKRAPIELLVRREGQPLERHEDRGNHGVGEPRAQERAQLRERGLLRRDDVGDELLSAVLLAHDDGGRTERRMRRERALDLVELDPGAAELDLSVEPAAELDRAVEPVAAAIAGHVQTIAVQAGERVEREALARECLVAEEAPREIRRAHVDVARLAEARESPAASSTRSMHAFDAPAERHGSFRRAGDEEAHRLGRLGRAVEVHARRVRRETAEPRRVPSVEPIPAEASEAQRGQRPVFGLGLGLECEPLPHRRGQVRDRDRARAHPARERAGRLELVLARAVRARPDPQRREEVAQQGIVRQSRQHAEPIARTELERARVPVEEVREWRVRADDPPRRARGARGEGHVGDVVGAELDGRRRRRAAESFLARHLEGSPADRFLRGPRRAPAGPRALPPRAARPSAAPAPRTARGARWDGPDRARRIAAPAFHVPSSAHASAALR